MDGDGVGLRDRKKQQTRWRLAHTATLLFIERGFDATTIADVATAADVSKNTVTNYFPLKEDLVFDAHAEVVDALAAAVRGAGPGESALDAVRRAFLASLDRFHPINGLCTPDFARLVHDTARLRAREREIDEEREDALAHELAGLAAPDDPPALLAAAQLAGAHRPVVHRGRDLARAGPVPASEAQLATLLEDAGRELTDLARTAFDLLRPVLGGRYVRDAGQGG